MVVKNLIPKPFTARVDVVERVFVSKVPGCFQLVCNHEVSGF